MAAGAIVRRPGCLLFTDPLALRPHLAMSLPLSFPTQNGFNYFHTVERIGYAFITDKSLTDYMSYPQIESRFEVYPAAYIPGNYHWKFSRQPCREITFSLQSPGLPHG
jgi:hypothetical protein